MAEPVSAGTSVAFGAGLTLAGLMTAAPLGIPVPSLAWGALFACVGVFGRGVYETQVALGKQDVLGLRYVLAWVMVGLLGSPFCSALVLYGLKLTSVQNDNITAFALMFMGFTGPKGITFVMSSAAQFINQRLAIKPGSPGFLPGEKNAGGSDGK
jgi:hypothetical protein